MKSLIKEIKDKPALFCTVLLLVISFATHWYVFFDTGLLNSGDWLWMPQIVIKNYINYNFWIPHTDFGVVSVFASNNVFYWIAGLLAYAHVSWDVYTRIFFLIPIIFFTPLFSFLLFKDIFNDDISAFSAASLYSFNTLFLKLQLDDITYGFIWWILPGLFLSILRFLQSRNKKYLIFNIILIFVGIVYELRITLLVLAYICLFLLLYLFFNTENIKQKVISLSQIFLSFFIAIVAHTFWLLPLKASNLASDVLSNASPSPFASYFNLIDSITLHYYGWVGNTTISPFIPEPASARLFIVPIIALMGLVFYRKSLAIKENYLYFLFFSTTLIISIFLGKQAFQPFTNTYSWLFYNLPLFNLYRESSKFFILIALSLSFFFGIGITYLISLLAKYSSKLRLIIILLVLIIGIFFNTQHFLDQKIGGMTKGVTIPTEYQILNNKLSADFNYYRILYIPNKPRFAFFSELHPAVYDTDFIPMFKESVGFTLFDRSSTPSEQLLYLLQQPYSKFLLSLGSIKYVVLPINQPQVETDLTGKTSIVNEPFYDYGNTPREWYIDQLNAIPWLRKQNFEDKNLTVYENDLYRPSIYSFTNLHNLDITSNLNQKYNFITNQLGEEFYFTSNLSSTSVPVSQISNLFENISISNVSDKLSTTKNQLSANNNQIFVNDDYGEVNINSAGATLEVQEENTGNLSINDNSISTESKDSKTLLSIPNSNNIYVSYGDYFKKVSDSNLSLGLASSSKLVSLYQATQNVIPNPSFEDGAWQSTVGDCNNYSNDSVLSMEIDHTHKTEGEQSLELDATNHIACTSHTFAISGGEHVFSFDYQSPNAKVAGYYLSFNDKNKTIINETIPVTNANWNTFIKKIEIPTDATSVTLFIYSYSLDGSTKIINRYDNFNFSKLNKISNVKIPYINNFQKIQVPLKKASNAITYSDSNYKLDNILNNGSFENGLWQPGVGDCNNFDSNPKLGMSLNTNNVSEGKFSLQLDATRHTACTSQNVPVEGGSSYLMSFDYQSSNAKSASYYVSFNGSSTPVAESINIKDSNWHSYSKIIQAPEDANQLALYVYAQSSDGSTKVINNYDNFKIIKVPNLLNAYYLVSSPSTLPLVEPDSISFNLVNPTTKTVHIKKATTSFFLAMSEAWHPSWQLEMNNSKIHGFFSQWTPLAHPDKVPDDEHFELDDFLNGWYVDVHQLCEVQHVSGCTKNADGSYNLEMKIEFWPQRWFYVGLVISGTTLVAVLGYLGYALVKERRRKRALTQEKLITEHV